MAKESLLVVLRYGKDKSEIIESVLQTESIVTRRSGTNGPDIRGHVREPAHAGVIVPEAALPDQRGTQIEEALFQLRRVLRHVDYDETVTRSLRIVKETLQSFRDSNLMEVGAQSSINQSHSPAEEQGAQEAKSTSSILHGHHEDYETRIEKLVDENRKLGSLNEVFEKANNELICDVETNEIKLAALERELRGMREKEDQLKSVEASFNSSKKTTDKAFELLSSIKDNNTKYEKYIITLEEGLKTCRAEKDRVLIDSRRQNEIWQGRYRALVDENRELEGKMTGLKRKLGDLMTDIDQSTANKRRQPPV